MPIRGFKLMLAALIVALTAAAAPFGPVRAMDEDALVRAVIEAYDPAARQPAAAVGFNDTITTLNLRVIAAWDSLSHDARRRIEPYIRVETLPNGHMRINYPQLEELLAVLNQNHSTQRFDIHYSTTHPQEKVSTLDVNPANGVPDYIDLVADALEYAYDFQINQMGFDAPAFETGKSRHQVYVLSIAPDYLGMAAATECYGIICPAFMLLDNNYSHPALAFLSMPVEQFVYETAAHEFQHLIQFGAYQAFLSWEADAVWIAEATATWIEVRMFPESWLYLLSLEEWFANPQLPLTTFATDENPWHGYGSMIYIKFLWERYGGDRAVVSLWELARDMGSGRTTGELVRNHIQQLGYEFDDVFLEFGIANYMKDYDGGEDLPDIRIGYELGPAASHSMSAHSRELTSNYARVWARETPDTAMKVGVGAQLSPRFGVVTQAREGQRQAGPATLIDADWSTYLSQPIVDDENYDHMILVMSNPLRGASGHISVTPERLEATHCIEIEAGWNLAALPMAPLSLPRGPGGQTFIEYSSRRMLPDSAPDFSRAAHPGRGFWVRSVTARELCFFGWPHFTVREIPLTRGWNIVGSPSSAGAALDPELTLVRLGSDQEHTLAQALAQGLVGAQAFEYDPMADDYSAVELINGAALEGAAAIWIKVSEDMTLVFPDY